MISYRVSCAQPHRHFIQFEMKFRPPAGDHVLLSLAHWRPGRYEAGHFARNIRTWQACDEKGKPLHWRKTDRNTWRVECHEATEVIIRYEYYAAEMNAGSSYVDHEQLYINPVNCFFYLAEKPDEAFAIHLVLPDDYKVVCQLAQPAKHMLEAPHFDALADAPLMASASLQKLAYQYGEADFELWFQGRHEMNTEQLLTDFKKFTETQIQLFGDIPCRTYRFMYQLPHYFIRHGVEHSASTVIAMGPAENLKTKKLYDDFLGISSHELFHTWNVKCIRPADMLPYDFSRENYSRLGYVYEGVTTYYGDLVLLRCGVFGRDEYFKEFDDLLNDHFHNPGRFNHSVADSSWDTWLDGYTPGIPWRKVSIYTEGALIAFICDVEIMRATQNQHSLDDVMRLLYERFGKTRRGYTESDYRILLEEVSGISFEMLFNELVWQPGNYEPWLHKALSYLGLEMHTSPNEDLMESRWGIKTTYQNNRYEINQIWPGSPADKAGMWVGDAITIINGVEVSQPLVLENSASYEIDFVRKKVEMKVHLHETGEYFYPRYRTTPVAQPGSAQQQAYAHWCSLR